MSVFAWLFDSFHWHINGPQSDATWLHVLAPTPDHNEAQDFSVIEDADSQVVWGKEAAAANQQMNTNGLLRRTNSVTMRRNSTFSLAPQQTPRSAVLQPIQPEQELESTKQLKARRAVLLFEANLLSKQIAQNQK